MQEYDAIVIGGGMSGAWLTYFLSLEGQKVLLLEKDFFGSGTTAKSASTIEYFYKTKWDSYSTHIYPIHQFYMYNFSMRNI
jgi:glycine/D-amino acid oxidase-like deaminating enzyme